MMGYTHAAFALLLVSFAGLRNPVLILPVIIGSLLPDMDTTNSLIGRMLFPLSFQINRRYGHRTVSHSMLAILIIAGLSALYYLFVRDVLLFWFLVGYVSHLAADMMNPTGIPLIYPDPTAFVMLGGPVPVKSMRENMMLAVIIVLLILLMLWKSGLLRKIIGFG